MALEELLPAQLLLLALIEKHMPSSPLLTTYQSIGPAVAEGRGLTDCMDLH